ncbi:elongator complex protein 5-like [Diadema antillarum]|uniref:elongator complex protein 5-like n=1 Tax=Diadema antillarum TaxID=105358 RepID=UPI003A841F9A
MTSLIKQIVSGSECSSSILIQDTVEHSGRHILRCFIKEIAKRVDEVHLFAFDRTPDALLAGSDPETRLKVMCHDGWTDPQGWNQASVTSCKHNLVRFTSDKDLVDHVRDTRRTESKVLAVVVDSLTPHIVHRTVPVTCQALHSLTHLPDKSDFQIQQVLSLLHRDVHDEAALRAIGHLSMTVIAVSPNMSIAPLDAAPMGFCDILHKRPSGKVLRKREGYSICDDYRLLTFTDVQKTAERMEEEHQLDPTANLTFNLTLKDSERKAKENVILPFTKVAENASRGSGQIFYEPDQADDYDDEDPDDDLDI